MKRAKLIPKLEPVPETDEPKVAGSEPEEGHYSVDEKMRQVELTEAGHQVVEELENAEAAAQVFLFRL